MNILFSEIFRHDVFLQILFTGISVVVTFTQFLVKSSTTREKNDKHVAIFMFYNILCNLKKWQIETTLGQEQKVG